MSKFFENITTQRKRIGLIREFTEGEETKANILWIVNILITISLITITILSFTTAHTRKDIDSENKSLYMVTGFISIIFLVIFLIPKYFNKINLFYIFYSLLGLIILCIILGINYGPQHIYRKDKYLNSINLAIIGLMVFVIIAVIIGIFLYYYGVIESPENDFTINPKIAEELNIAKHFKQAYDELNIALNPTIGVKLKNKQLENIQSIEKEITGEFIVDNENFSLNYPELFYNRMTEIKNLLNTRINSKKRFLKGLNNLKEKYQKYQESNKYKKDERENKLINLTKKQKKEIEKIYNKFDFYVLPDITNNYIKNKLEQLIENGEYFTPSEYVDVFGLPDKNTEYTILDNKQLTTLSNEISKEIIKKERTLNTKIGKEKEDLKAEIEILKGEKDGFQKTIQENTKTIAALNDGQYQSGLQAETEKEQTNYIKSLSTNIADNKIDKYDKALKLLENLKSPEFRNKFVLLDENKRKEISEQYNKLLQKITNEANENNEVARDKVKTDNTLTDEEKIKRQKEMKQDYDKAKARQDELGKINTIYQDFEKK